MNAMDVINEICICSIKLYNTSSFHFFKRLKLSNRIADLEEYLYKQDIFTLSDTLISFLSGAPNYIIEDDNVITVKKGFMGFSINSCYIDYNPKKQEFKITDSNYGIYNVIKGTKLTKSRKERWAKLEEKIKVFYMEIISNAAWALAGQQSAVVNEDAN